MKNGKCFLYCRQSSGQDDADNSTSIAQQLENCRVTAKKNGLEIVDIFTDANVSGKTYPGGSFFEKIAENDPGYQKWFLQQTSRKKYRSGLGGLLKRIEEVEYIVVDEITRLHRSAGASFLEQTINYVITEAHVKILQVKGGMIDLARFDQNLIQILRTQINDEQIANQKRKSLESRKRLKDSGILCDAKFFGAVYEGNKHFHFDPEKIPVIRYIFNAIESNVSYGEICCQVNKQWLGLFPGRLFYESSLYNIARQPAYAGLMYNSSGELITCANAPEAVITPALFLSVMKKMEERRRVRARPRALEHRHHFLPLSGLLKCGICGHTMRVNIDRGKIFYICRCGNLNRDSRCREVRILDMQENSRAAGLRQAVIPLTLFGLHEEYRAVHELQHSNATIGKLQQKLEHLNRKIDTVFQLYRKDHLDEQDFTRITLSAVDEQRKLRLKLKELEVCRESDISGTIESLNRIRVELEKYGEIRNEESFSFLIRKSIEEIRVFRNHVEIKMQQGEIHLPRLPAKQNRRILPKWKLEYANNKENLYFTIRYLYGGKRENGILLLKTEYAEIKEMNQLENT